MRHVDVRDLVDGSQKPVLQGRTLPRQPRWFVCNTFTHRNARSKLTCHNNRHQFKKPFTFRKKRGDDGGIPDVVSPYTRNGDNETLSPQPFNHPIPSRDPSPGRSSISPSNLSLTGTSDSYFQANRDAGAIDQDPLGLKIIHRPPGVRRVDIIFVHGLGGSSRTTWSKHHNLEFFWPLKFLPFEPDINEARILTFGYNANFRRKSGRNKISVLDFAKDLLYDLKYAKDESVPELEDLGMGEACIVCVLGYTGELTRI